MIVLIRNIIHAAYKHKCQVRRQTYLASGLKYDAC